MSSPISLEKYSAGLVPRHWNQGRLAGQLSHDIDPGISGNMYTLIKNNERVYIFFNYNKT